MSQGDLSSAIAAILFLNPSKDTTESKWTTRLITITHQGLLTSYLVRLAPFYLPLCACLCCDWVVFISLYFAVVVALMIVSIRRSTHFSLVTSTLGV